jgi:hypothetical protein
MERNDISRLLRTAELYNGNGYPVIANDSVPKRRSREFVTQPTTRELCRSCKGIGHHDHSSRRAATK